MVRKQSSGEREFLHWWNLLSGMPPPTKQEYAFAKKSMKRNWRFDFSWPEHMLAVEIDGGEWLAKVGKKSRHMTGQGYQDDCDKLNAAAILGWRVMRFTPTMIKNDPAGCIEKIKKAMGEGNEY